MQIVRAIVLSFCAFMILPTLADEVETTLENFRTAGAGGFIEDAYGYAVFPSIGKGGIGIGGAHGKGFVYQDGERSSRKKIIWLYTCPPNCRP